MRQAVLTEAIHLVRSVGEFIRTASNEFSVDNIEKKGFNDLVSYVDKEAELKLVAGCRKILPEAGFITEEGTADHRSDRYNWIIDPLDGTTNFVHGLPVYAISLALTDRNEVIMGIVYEICADELFHAKRGDGAYCNGDRINVSPINRLSESLLATGFPYYDFGQMPVYLDILNDFMQNTHGLRRLGSAAVDLAYTACGRFEGFFEYNLNAWDVAAGILLVEEAGGIVTDFAGDHNALFGREIIAAGSVHGSMMKIIQSHWHRTN